ncbi:hypothetical protein M758_8G106800 [Ceratodon purpureus]|uniref:Secreted protein n=1 Tax=Ceratodon purpureus TaxID=3225 RepID=A0A8T0GXM9_CERPU|nr:hypothetical protein KC19_8G110200 [Ceratodon purpureus]KAG0608448.1 hypothetical protein M758_8G106800 [Ceratodon purpureus]
MNFSAFELVFLGLSGLLMSTCVASVPFGIQRKQVASSAFLRLHFLMSIPNVFSKEAVSSRCKCVCIVLILECGFLAFRSL